MTFPVPLPPWMYLLCASSPFPAGDILWVKIVPTAGWSHFHPEGVARHS
jgi:hypothetical protein